MKGGNSLLKKQRVRAVRQARRGKGPAADFTVLYLRNIRCNSQGGWVHLKVARSADEVVKHVSDVLSGIIRAKLKNVKPSLIEKRLLDDAFRHGSAWKPAILSRLRETLQLAWPIPLGHGMDVLIKRIESDE